VTTIDLAALKAVHDLRSFAPLIGFRPAGLAYLLHALPEGQRYKTFEIPKKSGGTRRISAPEPRLALAQRRLGDLLAKCWEEITAAEPERRALSHGFHLGRSIVTNARQHNRRRYVLNLDIADFFGTINFGRVRGFFIRDRRFSLPPSVATIIAQISCYENALPQGGPSSPVISNLVGHILDIRLVRLAKIYRARYTRYVDDITFSTNERKFPEALSVRVGATREWQLGTPLRQAITRAGFTVNDAKTRMQITGSRQVTTGLIVNEKVNVASEYYRDTRAMCSALFRCGHYHLPSKTGDRCKILCAA
jgi:RNA-directed DNA polymerase